jgi:hypothetical protein
MIVFGTVEIVCINIFNEQETILTNWILPRSKASGVFL